MERSAATNHNETHHDETYQDLLQAVRCFWTPLADKPEEIPSTQKYSDRDSRHRKHRCIFGDEIKGESETAIFRVETAGQF